MKLGSSSIVTVQFVATVMAYLSQIHNFLAGLPTAAVTITALSSQENSLSDFNGDDKQTTLWRLAQKSCPRIGWRRRGRGWL